MSTLPGAELAASPPVLPGGALGRALLRLASPGGTRGLSIMVYHRVLAAPDPLFPGETDRAVFSHQLDLLKASCTVLPLLDAVRLLGEGRLPPRAACITFDDGYADNATEALPLLQRHGLHATFFVATGFLDGGRMWNDTIIELVRKAPPGAWLDAAALGLPALPLETLEQRRCAIATLIGKLKYVRMAQRLEQVAALAARAGYPLADDLMMRGDQVLQLRRAGMHIGAHTSNHPILAALPAQQAVDEIASGKQALETLLGEKIPLFAYPNGKPGTDYRAEHVDMVRALGFEGAVSTAWGGRCTDPLQLPRFTPWDRTLSRFQLRLASNLLRKSARM